jgi:hypothetical protein
MSEQTASLCPKTTTQGCLLRALGELAFEKWHFKLSYTGRKANINAYCLRT